MAPSIRSPKGAVADAQLAAIFVALGASLGGPLRLAVGLPLLLAALYCASVVLWRLDQPRRSAWRPAVALLLGTLAVVGLLAPRGMGPDWYVTLRRAYFIAGFLAVAVWTFRPATKDRTLVLPLVVGATLVHVLGVMTVTDPFIDTWGWTQACLRALTAGIHPYTVDPAAIAHASFWAGQTAPSYPYMPLTLVVFLPLYLLLGDYRFLGAALFPTTVLLLRGAGRRLEVDRDTLAISGFVVLLLPRQFEATVWGYIEPIMAVTFAGFAYAAVRQPGGLWQATAFVSLLALKQYLLTPFVLFVTMRTITSRRTLVIAGALAGVAAVPFLWWNAAATLSGMTTQMTALAEPRLDATSLVALFSVWGLGEASRWLSVATQVFVGVIAYRRARNAGVGGLLLATALSLLATFLAGWQAFPNYYLFISVILAVGSLFLRAPGGPRSF